jgi:3-hydroxyisobutyrate dehydrogenase-like beta-hydroxyacid dehydrogenase
MRLAFIGFGEVGQRFGGQLAGRPGTSVVAWDIKFPDPVTGAPLRAAAEAAGIRIARDAADAIEGAGIVVSAVTAMAAAEVAEAAVGLISADQIFMDINSISPGTKARLSALYLSHGRHYVEGAVMAPVAEPGIAVSILSGGERAADVAERLNPLGFRITPVTPIVGRAAATKLCRSIMIKGLEALIIRASTAARAWDVEDDVYRSLAETFPSIDWPRLAETMSARVRRHGIRRAAEMRECGEMLDELPQMAETPGAARAGDIARAIADVHEDHARTHA